VCCHGFDVIHDLELGPGLRVLGCVEPGFGLGLRTNWKTFLTHYVKAIEILTKSVEYEPGDIVTLEGHIEKVYCRLIAVAGIQETTNYFH
jgi:hypothetical protein